jgi:aminoglycoside phosphotransferase (APT) family kinase protein
LDVVERLVAAALPRRRVVHAESLSEGLSNRSWRVRLDPPLDVVLRVYERDPAACRKEVDLLALVRGALPVPELLHAEPDGVDGVGPFALLRWVDGVTLRELKRTRDAAALADAAASVGETLATIGRFTFERAGWLDAGPVVGAPLLDGADAMPRFVDGCLTSPHLVARVPEGLRGRAHEYVWSMAPRLAALEGERRLVHCDFGGPNIVVRELGGRWRVAAVLDWEFAVSATPLIDVGHFLRYERASAPWREPHFSRAFVAHGGELPDDWRRLARALDLTALCEMLARERLPDAVARELTELVAATVEDRDPRPGA